MNDDLTIPDFLVRKNHPENNTPLPKNVSWKIKNPSKIVWPHWKPEPKKREETKPLNGLTAGEQEELTEIKAMAKTNIDLAKSMATEWLNRTTDRKVQARRRSALQTVKNLYSHRRKK